MTDTLHTTTHAPHDPATEAARAAHHPLGTSEARGPVTMLTTPPLCYRVIATHAATVVRPRSTHLLNIMDTAEAAQAYVDALVAPCGPGCVIIIEPYTPGPEEEAH